MTFYDESASMVKWKRFHCQVSYQPLSVGLGPCLSGAMKPKTRSRIATPGRPRMEDVARLAGVSLVTVSRVLNTPDAVTPATRQAVMAAVRRIGYVPNLTAGALAGSRSRIIAAIVPTIANSIFADTIQGLSDRLERAGYTILLGQTGYDAQRERALVTAMLGRRPDALMLVGAPLSPATGRMLAGAGIPIVQTWEMMRRPIDHVVGFSNATAGRVVAEHFVARGYRHIGFVGGADARSKARREGFETALVAAGITPLPAATVPSPGMVANGRDSLSRILAEGKPVDALFLSTDVLAIGALLECQRQGIAVPQRLAIAGFGDQDLAREMVPPLTTVRISGLEIGDRAADLLLDAVAGKPSGAQRIDLGVQLIVRATT